MIILCVSPLTGEVNIKSKVTQVTLNLVAYKSKSTLPPLHPGGIHCFSRTAVTVV